MNRRSRCYLTALSLTLAACALPVLSNGISIAGRPLAAQLAVMLLLAALLGVYTRLARAPRLRLALEASLFGIVISTAFNFPMYLLARHGGGFADGALRRADAALGIDVPALARWVSLHPRVEHTQALIYGSLHLVSGAALLIPALAGRSRWVSELLVALAVSVLASLLILTCVRAIGPWDGGAFGASVEQQSCAGVLRALQAGTALTIDLSRPAPLIAFPSWHVILALLSAHALGRFEYLRVPAIVWATAIALSTLTSGWHYGVDVLGGVAVAASSIFVSKALHGFWARTDAAQGAFRMTLEPTFANGVEK